MFFTEAYEFVKRWENRKTKNGLIIYSNDKDDAGGETIFGIARKSWPNHSIWNKVDELKKDISNNLSESEFALEISHRVLEDETIEEDIKSFYREQYWNKFKGDEINNKAFAIGLMSIAVNAGVKRGIILGQRACNISDDGIYGPNTKKAFNNSTNQTAENLIEKQKEYYLSIIEKRPTNAKYKNGWFNRAESIREYL